MNKINFEKLKIRLLSLLIPIFCFLLILYTVKLWPFGEQTIVSLDLDSQYISFFSYLKEIFRDPTTLFYSFSKTLGGDMIGLVSYYLMSPFNLIALFFSTSNLPIALTLIIILKIGSAGYTFNLFLKNNGYNSLIFSTAYALMAFVIANYSNVIWLDGIILLPLIAMGIEKIMVGKSPAFYIFSLSASIFTNYYIGYMLCIFSVIYFFYCFYFKEETRSLRSSKVFINFCFASIISGGLAAVLLIPVKYSLETTKGLFDLSSIQWQANLTLRDLFSKLILGSYNFNEAMFGKPNIYCSYIGLLSFVFYFLNKRIDKKEKTGCFLILLLFLVSFIFEPINLIWHGFSKPNWFPYRYSFIFTFFVLLIGHKGLNITLEGNNKRIVLLSAGMLSLFILIGYMGNFSYLNIYKFLASLIFISFIILYLLKNIKAKGTLLVVLVLELTVNGYFGLKEIPHLSLNEYKTYVDKVEPIIKSIRKKDSGFYRFEKTFQRTQNDPMLLNYSGLSHNSSAEAPLVRSYLYSQLGLCTEDNWTYYNSGTTYANDSLLGIKYILTEQKISMGYTALNTYGDSTLYLNDFTLPFGFLTSGPVHSFYPVDFSWLSNQNNIWKVLSNNENLEIMKSLEFSIIKNDIIQNGDYFNYIVNGEDPFLEYQFAMPKKGPVFIYLTSNDERKVKLFINDEYLCDYFTYGQHQMIRLGEYDKDERVTLKLKLEEEQLDIQSVNLFYQDMDVFEEAFTSLIYNNTLMIESKKNGYIAGHIEVKEPSNLILQIPYDQNWRFYVDGKKVNSYESLGIYSTLYLDEGFHDIRAIYIPRGLKLGITITIISLIIMFIWLRMNEL
ncbi:YfhO family protein [Holdemania filiformis]|uniref:YfhO family protein n=1 Tax=Holdemania filiformis TaxID=61171 RepID=UPI002108B821|nr:YfhO family protein [Holdemania filiformis]MCQ4954428.1 YfhO family protein [Holdemania filiformis]